MSSDKLGVHAVLLLHMCRDCLCLILRPGVCVVTTGQVHCNRVSMKLNPTGSCSAYPGTCHISVRVRSLFPTSCALSNNNSMLHSRQASQYCLKHGTVTGCGNTQRVYSICTRTDACKTAVGPLSPFWPTFRLPPILAITLQVPCRT